MSDGAREFRSEDEIRDWAKKHAANGCAQPEASDTPMTVDEIPPLRSISNGTIEWDIHPYIARKSITAFSGDGGCGKSHLLSDLLRRAWRNGHPVLLLDRENGADVVCERHNFLAISDDPDYRIWGGWCRESPPDPASGAIQRWVHQHAERHPIVGIDSLVSFCESDENDNSAMRKVLDRWRTLTHIGASLALINHSGKADTAKQWRGASGIRDGVDRGLLIQDLSRPGIRLESLRVTTWKARVGAPVDAVLKLQDGEFLIDDRSEQEVLAGRLEDLLRANPGIQTRQWEEVLKSVGIPRDPARIWLARAIDEGRAEETKQGRATRYRLLEPEEL
ncbi:MAG: AAA family ATPase [Bryobacterales bacterium]|nr:AAA family ATPase [Bryobacterales bacterium]